jgi:hypothetical protein
MGNPKAPKKAAAKPKAAEPEDIEPVQTTQTAAQKAFLERAARFLVNINSRQYSPRAKRNGYTTDEHREGWRLYNKAAGADRPLEHWFSEQGQSASAGDIAGDRLRLLTEIDTFENTWFPRVRAVIRRMVPSEHRDAFAAAFFANLAQQPLGPSVVGSVATLLQRIEGLEKSKEPGAGKVFTTLKARGLTDKKIAEVRALLKEAEEGSPKASKKKPAVSIADLAKAQTEQEEAFEGLKDWFNDWATQLRPAFNVREQVVLGLTLARGRSSSGEDAEAIDEPANDAIAAEPFGERRPG